MWVKKYSFRGTETKNINFRLHSHPNKNELGVSRGPKYYGILDCGKKNQFWNCYAAQMRQNYPKGQKNQSEIKTRHEFHLLNMAPQATLRVHLWTRIDKNINWIDFVPDITNWTPFITMTKWNKYILWSKLKFATAAGHKNQLLTCMIYPFVIELGPPREAFWSILWGFEEKMAFWACAIGQNWARTKYT